MIPSQVYDHKIFRYLENPLESLSSIKDNEHIVAYRFNHMHKGPGKAKLEILHGELEKSVCLLFNLSFKNSSSSFLSSASNGL